MEDPAKRLQRYIDRHWEDAETVRTALMYFVRRPQDYPAQAVAAAKEMNRVLLDREHLDAMKDELHKVLPLVLVNGREGLEELRASSREASALEDLLA